MSARDDELKFQLGQDPAGFSNLRFQDLAMQASDVDVSEMNLTSWELQYPIISRVILQVMRDFHQPRATFDHHDSKHFARCLKSIPDAKAPFCAHVQILI